MHQSERSKSSIPHLIRDKKTPILRSRGNSVYFGVTDRGTTSITLKFITSTGQQRAINYHDILSPMDYDGESEILLRTRLLEVCIKGRNLEDLFDEIIQHRVMWISEPQSSFANDDAEQPEVTSIRFEDPAGADL
jgi:hypothetical protein